MSKSLEEITRRINELLEAHDGKIPQAERREIEDELINKAWQCAGLLDRVQGIDTLKGPRTKYGTRNHKSYTYKVRKALGYSYP